MIMGARVNSHLTSIHRLLYSRVGIASAAALFASLLFGAIVGTLPYLSIPILAIAAAVALRTHRGFSATLYCAFVAIVLMILGTWMRFVNTRPAGLWKFNVTNICVETHPGGLYCSLSVPADSRQLDPLRRLGFSKNLAINRAGQKTFVFSKSLDHRWIIAFAAIALPISFGPLIGKWRRTRYRRAHQLCVVCGYPKAMLTKSRCPECGAAFAEAEFSHAS